jgi:hypothetical protein
VLINISMTETTQFNDFDDENEQFDVEEEVKEPHELLGEILPEVLEEGAVLIQFKSEDNAVIVPSVILTLHPDECPIDQCPEKSATPNTLWAWNVRHTQWYLLDLVAVDDAQTWPPEDGSTPTQ